MFPATSPQQAPAAQYALSEQQQQQQSEDVYSAIGRFLIGLPHYASASPVSSMLDSSSPMTSDLLWMPSSNSTMVSQQDLEFSLFDPVAFPMTLTLENYIVPSAAENSFLSQPQQQMQQMQSVAQPQTLGQAISRKIKSHHRRTSSGCSAISAYESTAHRQHRASSISSVGSVSSSTSSTATTTTGANARPVKSYACPTCTKPFPTRTQLKSHMAIHTDSFPFPCEYAGCDLHFKRKHDLRRHVDAKHATVKKYICTAGCGEGFGRRDQMVRHLRRGTCSQSQGFQTE
ncbi:hypothetical protein BGX31_001389 [Mortierella sp. GBA43]|nr:hypothetical protein BGX31_001389 [Mortierella sp. GBA43]